jgi:hypothetical protein
MEIRTLNEYSVTNGAAWAARTVGKVFVGTANAIQ